MIKQPKLRAVLCSSMKYSNSGRKDALYSWATGMITKSEVLETSGGGPIVSLLNKKLASPNGPVGILVSRLP